MNPIYQMLHAISPSSIPWPLVMQILVEGEEIAMQVLPHLSDIPKLSVTQLTEWVLAAIAAAKNGGTIPAFPTPVE